MEINKDILTAHNNNAPLITVTVGLIENTEIWNNCISSEFPIMNMDINKGKAICQIGSPHQGYTLRAKQKNGKLDGKAILYDYYNRIVAYFTYQEGVANGKCEMYYSSGGIYFSGFLQKGYRNGPGVEYRKDGSVIYEGFYKNGCQAPNIKQRSDGSNYWNEKDEYGRMVSMFQIDDIGLYHGICYIYCNGEISKISRWEHGKEMEFLKMFNGLTMIMFENGRKVFSGRYNRKSDFEYVPIYPTKIETKSDSIKSKKEKKRDCKCTCHCFIEYIQVIAFWMVGIAAGDFCLAMILGCAFPNSEFMNELVKIMFGLFAFLFSMAIVSLILYTIALLCL